MLTGVISWILLGLIAGYIASALANKHGKGLASDSLLGIVGAVIGGCSFSETGLWSHLFAAVGAVAIVVFWHTLIRPVRHA